jgi:hypothetical protein
MKDFRRTIIVEIFIYQQLYAGLVNASNHDLFFKKSRFQDAESIVSYGPR